MLSPTTAIDEPAAFRPVTPMLKDERILMLSLLDLARGLKTTASHQWLPEKDQPTSYAKINIKNS
jgi:hypothetical protein